MRAPPASDRHLAHMGLRQYRRPPPCPRPGWRREPCSLFPGRTAPWAGFLIANLHHPDPETARLKADHRCCRHLAFGFFISATQNGRLRKQRLLSLHPAGQCTVMRDCRELLGFPFALNGRPLPLPTLSAPAISAEPQYQTGAADRLLISSTVTSSVSPFNLSSPPSHT